MLDFAGSWKEGCCSFAFCCPYSTMHRMKLVIEQEVTDQHQMSMTLMGLIEINSHVS
jgi:hypothetical protein